MVRPLNTVKPKFVAFFMLSGTADSFRENVCSSVTGTKREAILFLSGGK